MFQNLSQHVIIEEWTFCHWFIHSFIHWSNSPEHQLCARFGVGMGARHAFCLGGIQGSRTNFWTFELCALSALPGWKPEMGQKLVGPWVYSVFLLWAFTPAQVPQGASPWEWSLIPSSLLTFTTIAFPSKFKQWVICSLHFSWYKALTKKELEEMIQGSMQAITWMVNGDIFKD